MGTALDESTARRPDLAIGSLESVITVQLRAVPPNPILPPSPIYGWGNLQLRVNSVVDNSCVPPNPITPEPGFTLVAVCGRIFNEGGALYTGGGIYLFDPLGDSFSILIASFGGTIPNDPCRRYDIAGAITVPDAVAADMISQTTSYAVRFDGDVGGSTTRIGGRLDGSAWGPVGERPETDPFFADKVCSVAVAP